MTIPKMAFGVKCVRDFLASNGCVFTVRGFDYRTTAAVVPELGDIMVTRRKVCEITAIDDLTGFLSMSGFNTVSEWWVQIRRFCKGSMYLYLIKITDTWLSREEQDNEKQTQQRVLTEQNAWSNKDEIDEIINESTHPMDIRSDPAMRDPALVDLQPYKDAVHDDRIQRERRQAERRRDYLRNKYDGQGEIKTFVRIGA